MKSRISSARSSSWAGRASAGRPASSIRSGSICGIHATCRPPNRSRAAAALGSVVPVDRFQYLRLLGACLVGTLPARAASSACGSGAARPPGPLGPARHPGLLRVGRARHPRRAVDLLAPLHDRLGGRVRPAGRGARLLPRHPRLRGPLASRPCGSACGGGERRGRVHRHRALGAASSVAALELAWLSDRLLRPAHLLDRLAIVLFFQVVVDGCSPSCPRRRWLYADGRFLGVRFPFDIPVEDFAVRLGHGARSPCCCGSAGRDPAPTTSRPAIRSWRTLGRR